MPVSDPRGAEDWKPAAQPVEKHSLDEIARRLAELDRAARADAAEAAKVAAASGAAEPPAKEDPFARIEARLKALGEELDRRARVRQEAAMRPAAPPAPAEPVEAPRADVSAVAHDEAARETAAATQAAPEQAVAQDEPEQPVGPVAEVAPLTEPMDASADAARRRKGPHPPKHPSAP